MQHAGYATDPGYAEKLIEVVERNGLQELDNVPKKDGDEPMGNYKIRQKWMPARLYPLKAPYAMEPIGLISHNTAGTASAEAEANYMFNSPSATSFHVVVDENEVIELVPFNRNCWHAGDGANGVGNRHYIGMEIARSMSDEATYLKAEDNAARYAAGVMLQYGWDVSHVRKHMEFSNTACPHRTVELGWQRYIDKIAHYMKQEQAGTAAPQPEPAPEPDGPSDWAADAWEKATKAGIVDGSRPKDVMTREEYAASELRRLEENK